MLINKIAFRVCNQTYPKLVRHHRHIIMHAARLQVQMWWHWQLKYFINNKFLHFLARLTLIQTYLEHSSNSIWKCLIFFFNLSINRTKLNRYLLSLVSIRSPMLTFKAQTEMSCKRQVDNISNYRKQVPWPGRWWWCRVVGDLQSRAGWPHPAQPSTGGWAVMVSLLGHPTATTTALLCSPIYQG